MILSPIKALLLALTILSLTQCGIKKDPRSDIEQEGPHTHLKKAEKEIK